MDISQRAPDREGQHCGWAREPLCHDDVDHLLVVKVPLRLIFQGQGKISMATRHKLNKKRDSSGVEYTFQRKARVDEHRLIWWFGNCFLPMKPEKLAADTWAILFLDACGKTHMVQSFKDLCAENKVLCWYGESNMTHSWQPIDCSIGKTETLFSDMNLVSKVRDVVSWLRRCIRAR